MKKKSAVQEIRFFGKIGFLKPCAQTCKKTEKEIRCPRNPIFWEKSDFSKNRAQTCPKNEKEILCPRNPIFLEKSDFSNRVPKHAKKMKKKSAAQEIRFLGKIGFLKKPYLYLRNLLYSIRLGAILAFRHCVSLYLRNSLYSRN
jgi:hypothetical protein